MRLDAVIFDLDGTLVDTELLWADAMRLYLSSRQCDCPRNTLLQIVFGRSWTDIYRDVTSRFPVLAATPVHVMAEALRDVYLRLRSQSENVIIHSSAALLKTLSQEFPVIIVSGSPHADVEEAVRLLEATAQVRFVLGAEDYTPGKPAPAGFLLGARRLGVAPANCLVFEDSHAGVTAAKAAGMWCIALDRDSAHPQDLSAADWVLPDLSAFSVEAFRRRITSLG